MRRNKLELAKLTKIKKINDATKAKVLSIANEDKQRNYLAKYNELLEKKIDGTMTSSESIMMSNLKSTWTTIENIVDNGNTLEASVLLMVSLEEIEAVVI